MANLTISEDVAVVEMIEGITAPVSEDVVAGQAVRLVVASGKLCLALATTAANVGKRPAIAVRSANAGQALTAMFKGILDVGDALDSLDFDAQVFMSDTAGTLADAAGTVSQVIGTVTPGWAHTTADKLLHVDL